MREAEEKGRKGMKARSSKRPANFLAASLIALVNYMRRVGTLRFRRKYDLSLVEGWMIARLGAEAPMSIDQLAARAGLAQSQVSRAVSDLVDRGLVVRGINLNFYREARLELSPKGAAVYRDIMADAPDYERRLTRGLSPTEVDALSGLLPKLIANAELNLSEETIRASGRESDDQNKSLVRESREERLENDTSSGYRLDRQDRRRIGRQTRTNTAGERTRSRAQRDKGKKH